MKGWGIKWFQRYFCLNGPWKLIRGLFILKIEFSITSPLRSIFLQIAAERRDRRENHTNISTTSCETHYHINSDSLVEWRWWIDERDGWKAGRFAFNGLMGFFVKRRSFLGEIWELRYVEDKFHLMVISATNERAFKKVSKKSRWTRIWWTRIWWCQQTLEKVLDRIRTGDFKFLVFDFISIFHSFLILSQIGN